MASLPEKYNDPSASNLNINKKLLVILSISLISILGVASINPAIASIGKSLSIPPQKVGLIMTIFLLPTSIGTLFFGVLADRIGKKKILITSLLVFALGGALCATAYNFRSLLEWRFLQGLGAASLESLELTLISDLYSGRNLTAVMGLNASLIGIGSTIYPLVGGVLAGFSWRYPFLLSLLAIPVALIILTQLKLPKQEKSTANLNLKTYLKNSWKSINNRQVLGLLFAVFSIFVLEFGTCFIYIPILAANSFHASEAQIGIILGAFSLSASLAASQVGFISRLISERTLVKVALIICTLSLLIPPAIHNAWLLIIPSILFGAGQGLAFPVMQAMLATLAPEGYRAGFMSLNVTFQALGRAMGPLLAGIAFGIWGMQGVFFASTGLAVITLIVFNSLPQLYHSQNSLERG